MKFQYDTAYANEVGAHYGKYESTFVSDRAEVIAHLFQEGDLLVAYISFAPGVSTDSVTDNYLLPLQHHAAEKGFAGKLHLRYS